MNGQYADGFGAVTQLDGMARTAIPQPDQVDSGLVSKRASRRYVLFAIEVGCRGTDLVMVVAAAWVTEMVGPRDQAMLLGELLGRENRVRCRRL